jgi:hypothetical protein
MERSARGTSEPHVAAWSAEAELEHEHLVPTAALPLRTQLDALHSGAFELADEPQSVGTLHYPTSSRVW